VPPRPPRTASALARWLCGLLVSLALGAWGGCQPEPATPSGAGPGVAAPVSARFWFSYGGRNREVLEELIARFHASQPHYRIDATFQGSYFDALAKLRTALITHEGPDFTHVIGEVLPYLWTAGVLQDLRPYLTGELPFDPADLVPELTQERMFAPFAGTEPPPLFALPFNRSTPIVFYDRDLFAAEGLSPPTTWEELRGVARRLTRREGAVTTRWGLEIPVDWWFWVALLYQAGGQLLDATGEQPRFQEAAGQEALQFLTDLVLEDQVLRPPPGQDYNAWEVANNDFLAGRAAMIWTSTAFLSYLTDNAPFRVGAAPLPGHATFGVPTGGTFFVLLRRASPEASRAAWAFLHFMMQPAQTAYWSRRTGYLPVNVKALALPEIAELYRQDPNYRVALDQLAVARPFPFSPALFTIQREQLAPRLDLPVLGLSDVASALEQAAAGARGVLWRQRHRCRVVDR